MAARSLDACVILPKWELFGGRGKAHPPHRRTVEARATIERQGKRQTFEVTSRQGWSGGQRTRQWWLTGGAGDELRYAVTIGTKKAETAQRWIDAVNGNGCIRFEDDEP